MKIATKTNSRKITLIGEKQTDQFSETRAKVARGSLCLNQEGAVSQFQFAEFWPEKFEFTNGSFELFCQVSSFQFGITIFCILSNGVLILYLPYTGK